MGEDYGYQDPEVEIKESGDVDFVEFTDSIADGKDHSVTFYDIAPEGSVMLVYNYDHAQDKLEVISYDDMIKYGGVNAAKEKGQLRSEGKEYVVQDGDMIYFRFNV